MDADEHGFQKDGGGRSCAGEEQWIQWTEAIIGCSFRVANVLGPGFVEKVHENALVHELRKNALQIEQQSAVAVFYDGVNVGSFSADIIVEGSVIVEIKAARDHNDVFVAQCLNYLKATGLPLCLLLNFGKPRVEIKRLRNGNPTTMI